MTFFPKKVYFFIKNKLYFIKRFFRRVEGHPPIKGYHLSIKNKNVDDLKLLKNFEVD